MFTESQLDDQHLFARIFEHAPIGMTIGSITGAIKKVNRAFCNMLGYSERELVGLSYEDITHPDDLAICVPTFQKLIHGELGSYQLEKRYLHKSGKVLSAILSVSIVQDEYGNPSFYISQVLDITEQKAQEEELKKIKELHELISENSQDMIIRSTSEGILTYVSPAVRDQLGYEPAELLGRNGYDSWHPEDVDYHWLEQGSQDSRKMVYRNRHKNGHYVWQESISKKIRNDVGEVQHVIAVCRDITERKKMELILKEYQERHKALLKYTPLGIFAIDLEGRFIEVNPAYQKITGYSAEELYGMTYRDLIPPQHLTWANEKNMDALRGNLPFLDMKIRHKNGTEIDIITASSPIIVNGETVGVYTVVKDVTNQKYTEELLQRAEKLSLVGELAAGIAHEIRNPLTSLRGFVQLFRSNPYIGKADMYYEIMASEIDRINEIVSELLVLAKPSKETYALCSIEDKLNDVVKLLEGEANLRNVVVRKDYDENLPFIQCQSSLKQVFINILKNSIESMPSGGDISIQVKRIEDKVYIRFTDEGCGISQEQLSRIGQPFFTTKETGTGLGLMVSQRIIQNHNGSLQIESKEGRGTIVEILLPVH